MNKKSFSRYTWARSVYIYESKRAQLTDIAVIVIAADDDIMPQTKEAMIMLKLQVFQLYLQLTRLTKTANPDKIKEGLTNMNLMVEDWGKIQSQDISALEGRV